MTRVFTQQPLAAPRSAKNISEPLARVDGIHISPTPTNVPVGTILFHQSSETIDLKYFNYYRCHQINNINIMNLLVMILAMMDYRNNLFKLTKSYFSNKVIVSASSLDGSQHICFRNLLAAI